MGKKEQVPALRSARDLLYNSLTRAENATAAALQGKGSRRYMLGITRNSLLSLTKHTRRRPSSTESLEKGQAVLIGSIPQLVSTSLSSLSQVCRQW